jgi:hypothetical protein
MTVSRLDLLRLLGQPQCDQLYPQQNLYLSSLANRAHVCVMPCLRDRLELVLVGGGRWLIRRLCSTPAPVSLGFKISQSKTQESLETT